MSQVLAIFNTLIALRQLQRARSSRVQLARDEITVNTLISNNVDTDDLKTNTINAKNGNDITLVSRFSMQPSTSIEQQSLNLQRQGKQVMSASDESLNVIGQHSSTQVLKGNRLAEAFGPRPVDYLPNLSVTAAVHPVSGSQLYGGGVLANDGRIFFIPFDAPSILVLDPETGSITTLGSFSGTGKWLGGVCVEDGRIISFPFDANSILIIDPHTNTFDLLGSFAGSQKWYGSCLGQNGHVYGIPFDSPNIIKLNPANNSVQTDTSVVVGTLKFSGGVLLPSGQIACVPSSATSILFINTVPTSISGVQSSLDVSVPLTGKNAPYFRGAVLGQSSRAFFVPFKSNQFFMLTTPSLTFAPVGAAIVGQADFVGATLGLDGNIYSFGLRPNAFIRLTDTPTVTTTLISHSVAGSFFGTVLSRRGRIYGAPWTSTNIVELKTLTPTLQPWMLSTAFNKY